MPIGYEQGVKPDPRAQYGVRGKSETGSRGQGSGSAAGSLRIAMLVANGVRRTVTESQTRLRYLEMTPGSSGPGPFKQPNCSRLNILLLFEKSMFDVGRLGRILQLTSPECHFSA